ncbi:DUF3850 domain-containing protein [Pseudaminobacter sp. 19-2017]|uniref:DUF3850 domain-containing protein n=1 Tax=Pseudaminobacter soli (ex Zhang et al. 2022) TaxID=2831468 RepID=A0A942I2H0_9HYPH|nr:DUF3850 domain-containing protein [Pseudaminobacter soli]MBS3648738.1 DUF3850 domain-containing protein [Pseudaminobacter soli]
MNIPAHTMKSWPAFFREMIAGKKTHDVRKKDRDFKVGQVIRLEEYEPFGGGYSGRSADFEITYITSNDTPCAMSSVVLDRDHCILSLKHLG